MLVSNSSSPSASSLFALPVDLFEGVLLFCQPLDVFHVALTCKRAHQHLMNNQTFWRQIYLKNWDDFRASANPDTPRPSSSGVKEETPWATRVWQADAAVRALKACRPREQDLETIIDLLLHSRPSRGGCLRRGHNINTLLELLADPAVLNAACCPDRFESRFKPLRRLDSENGDQSKLIESQASAQLSAMWNCPGDFTVDGRDAARSQVYDLSSYSPSTGFGPFTSEKDPDRVGQYVDWLQVEAIVRSIVPNTVEVFEDFDELESIMPTAPEQARPYTAPKPSNPRDWAGIEGQWRRAVCFLDYRDLFAFNIRRLQGHNPMVQSDEALRLLALDVHIVDYGSPDDPKDTLFPTLHFEGRTSGGTPHESIFRGKVSLMADGNVKWENISHYDGEDKWYTVAVSVGGVQSARGFFGVWSGIEHAFEDPAGSTWLFRRSKYDDL